MNNEFNGRCKNSTFLTKVISITLLFWFGLLINSFFISSDIINISKYAEKISFLGILILNTSAHILTLFFLIQALKNNVKTVRNDKLNISLWLLIIAISITIVDFCFYLATYLSNSYLIKLAWMYFILYYAPCIIYSFIMIVFLIKTLLQEVFTFKSLAKTAAVFLLIDAGIMYLFSCSVHIQLRGFPEEIIAQILLLSIELVLFNFSILGLFYASHMVLYFLLVGSILLVAGDFFITYSELSHTRHLFAYGELLWLLGVFSMMFAAIAFRRYVNHSTKHWFRSYSSVKSRLATWNFSISVIGFLVFFIILYFFSIIHAVAFIGLPLFVMIYSVIIVVLALIMGHAFESPFQKIESNINAIMMSENVVNLDESFSIKEFISLQKFISNSINLKKEKEKAKTDLYKIAEQVAHDIRSPVAAILMLARECIEIPETQRVTLRSAANRIQDIANVILHRYGNKKEASEYDLQPILVSATILSLVSEKRAEYKDTEIEFFCEPGDSSFSFILANIIGFKRIMSNLVNNAVEAMQDKRGKIVFSIRSNSNQVLISIVDTGGGMSKDKIQKIKFSEESISDKVDGHGIGWSQTKIFLKYCDATFDIESIIGAGTKIELTFKSISMPAWFKDNIIIQKESDVVVLDDDESIHGAWNALFSDILKSNPGVTLKHFTDSRECMEYINQCDNAEKITLLADYELINQAMNGLDVIAQVKTNQSVLVTSHYEDNDIIKRAILLNTKILPKLLAPNVKISLSSDVVISNLQETIDLVLLEDTQEVSSVITYLYKRKNKHIKVHHTVYELLENIDSYSLDTKICLDYDLNCPVNGIDVAKLLYEKGYSNIYLASGFDFKEHDIPTYVQVLNKKMSLINL